MAKKSAIDKLIELKMLEKLFKPEPKHKKNKSLGVLIIVFGVVMLVAGVYFMYGGLPLPEFITNLFPSGGEQVSCDVTLKNPWGDVSIEGTPQCNKVAGCLLPSSIIKPYSLTQPLAFWPADQGYVRMCGGGYCGKATNFEISEVWGMRTKTFTVNSCVPKGTTTLTIDVYNNENVKVDSREIGY